MSRTEEFARDIIARAVREVEEDAYDRGWKDGERAIEARLERREQEFAEHLRALNKRIDEVIADLAPDPNIITLLRALVDGDDAGHRSASSITVGTLRAVLRYMERMHSIKVAADG